MGRIRTPFAVLQRRHGGTQYRFGVIAAEKRDETVSVANSYGFVADRSKVARAISKQHRENFVHTRGLRVANYRLVGGVPIPVIQRRDQGMPCRFSVADRGAAPRWQAPATGCPLLSLGIFEIIRSPRDGEPF